MQTSLEGRTFDIIYIDGDHSARGALRNVLYFAPKVTPGGFLVMDDASLSLDIEVPYRGRTGPTEAADRLPSLGFDNVLDVGHNRIF